MFHMFILSALDIPTHLIFTITPWRIRKQRCKEINWLGQDHRWLSGRTQISTPKSSSHSAQWNVSRTSRPAFKGERLTPHRPVSPSYQWEIAILSHKMEAACWRWRDKMKGWVPNTTEPISLMPYAQRVTGERKKSLSDFNHCYLGREGLGLGSLHYSNTVRT